MLHSLYLLLLSLFFIGSLSAQNQELQNAEDAFAKQDYAKTMQHLSILLNAPQQLRGDEPAQVYMLRAKTHINILHNAIKAENEELMEANRDNYILAYQDLLEAKRKVVSEAIKKEIVDLSGLLQINLRHLGAQFLTDVYYNDKLNKEARTALLDEAQKYLMACIVLMPEDYLSYDFYGQVMMLKRNREGALKYFKLASSNYKLNSTSPDYGHFRVYANMAILYMQTKEVDDALEILNIGRIQLKNAYKQAGDTTDNQDYQRILQNMMDVEMDIYLNAPNKRPEALAKFKAAVNEKPDDYTLRLAYAGLLEQDKQTAESIAQYKAALELEENGFVALYNLGIIYLNQGLTAQQKASETTPASDKTTLTEEAQALYRLAVPILKRAHENKADDLPTLEALVLVTARLGMEEEYKHYRGLRKKLMDTTDED